MMTLIAAILAVPLIDQTAKRLVRGSLGSDELWLGRSCSFRIGFSRIWITRLANCPPSRVWVIWLIAAVPLLLATLFVSSLGLFSGLLLGGSLSHALETSWRGGVSDFVQWRSWPAFNLADIAIAGGAIGLLAHLPLIVATTLAG